MAVSFSRSLLHVCCLRRTFDPALPKKFFIMPPKRKPTKVEAAADVEEKAKRSRPTRNAEKVTEVDAPKTTEQEISEENGASGDAPRARRGRAAKTAVEYKEEPEVAPKAKRAAKPKAATKAAAEKPAAKAKGTRGRPKADKAKEDDDEAEEVKEDQAPVKKPKKEEPEDDKEEPVLPAKKTKEAEDQTAPKKTKKAQEEPVEEKVEPVPAKKTKKAASSEELKPKKPEKTEKAAKPEKPALQNVTETDHETIDYKCEKKNAKGDLPNLKISSWNVDGIRAWMKKDGLKYITAEDPDVLCLQETKCSEGKLPEEVKVSGYTTYWCGSDKEGYAGVGMYSKTEPLEVKYGLGNKDFDDEGRCITAEFEKYYLINVYVPNAGRGLTTLPKRLAWNEAFKAYVKDLDSKKPVIVCGDMNVAHSEIDLANPKTNKKSAGFTQEERDGMTDFLGDGYVDSYRELYPDKTDVYTFWTYVTKARAKNVGWRLDYFIVSKRIMDNICDNVVRSKVFGSDHCPVVLFVNL